jgi:hypothetical protein
VGGTRAGACPGGGSGGGVVCGAGAGPRSQLPCTMIYGGAPALYAGDEAFLHSCSYDEFC